MSEKISATSAAENTGGPSAATVVAVLSVGYVAFLISVRRNTGGWQMLDIGVQTLVAGVAAIACALGARQHARAGPPRLDDGGGGNAAALRRRGREAADTRG